MGQRIPSGRCVQAGRAVHRDHQGRTDLGKRSPFASGGQPYRAVSGPAGWGEHRHQRALSFAQGHAADSAVRGESEILRGIAPAGIRQQSGPAGPPRCGQPIQLWLSGGPLGRRGRGADQSLQRQAQRGDPCAGEPARVDRRRAARRLLAGNLWRPAGQRPRPAGGDRSRTGRAGCRGRRAGLGEFPARGVARGRRRGDALRRGQPGNCPRAYRCQRPRPAAPSLRRSPVPHHRPQGWRLVLSGSGPHRSRAGGRLDRCRLSGGGWRGGQRVHRAWGLPARRKGVRAGAGPQPVPESADAVSRAVPRAQAGWAHLQGPARHPRRVRICTDHGDPARLPAHRTLHPGVGPARFIHRAGRDRGGAGGFCSAANPCGSGSHPRAPDGRGRPLLHGKERTPVRPRGQRSEGERIRHHQGRSLRARRVEGLDLWRQRQALFAGLSPVGQPTFG